MCNTRLLKTLRFGSLFCNHDQQNKIKIRTLCVVNPLLAVIDILLVGKILTLEKHSIFKTLAVIQPNGATAVVENE